MLSYRHGFHAGGFGDVLKHAVYAFVLDCVTTSARPVFVLDTHAGAGRYDLESPMAQKTGEAARGVARLRAASSPAPALMRAYERCLERARPAYPGSPDIAWQILRKEDRLELVELHPTDHDLLSADFEPDPATKVVRADGLAHMRSVLPPPERRGVVLMDPAYEIKSEYETVPDALVRGWRRFGTGIFILWYPVIERARTDALLARLARSELCRFLRVELCALPDGAARGMTGCGLVIVNPPQSLEPALAEGLPWLAAALACEGPSRAGWIGADGRFAEEKG